MKIETKEIYKCEFCNKLYQLKHFAAKHEKICTKNPENKRACFGCKHLKKKQTIIYHDSPIGGSIDQPVSILFCKKKSIYVYPPRVEIKKNMYELGDDSNEPMPKECSEFSEVDYTGSSIPLSDGFSF
jgi:hypothetical protein